VHGNEVDRTRSVTFVTTFIPTLFGLARDTFQERMSDICDTTPPNEEVEDDAINVDDSSAGRGRKVDGRKPNLLRGVLDRGRLS